MRSTVPPHDCGGGDDGLDRQLDLHRLAADPTEHETRHAKLMELLEAP